EIEARCALFELAEYLDGERLSLNRQKTRIMAGQALLGLANRALDLSPASVEEESILETIDNVTTGPYEVRDFSELTPEQEEALSRDAVEAALGTILGAREVNYVRLRWFLRRLSQIG